jgi:hypothetical protein
MLLLFLSRKVFLLLETIVVCFVFGASYFAIFLCVVECLSRTLYKFAISCSFHWH